jgi:hypothetical protein
MHKILPEARILPYMGYHSALAHHGTHRPPGPGDDRGAPWRCLAAAGTAGPVGLRPVNAACGRLMASEHAEWVTI